MELAATSPPTSAVPPRSRRCTGCGCAWRPSSARERAGRFDLKTGRGGLLDIEFATQWLQMQHGRDQRVRTTDTAQALEALVTAGYLARPEYETFREAYTFLRRLEQRIHVLHATSATVIDVRSPGLTQLARRLGWPRHLAAQRGRRAARALSGRDRSGTQRVRTRAGSRLKAQASRSSRAASIAP